jgi:hypothetical protein
LKKSIFILFIFFSLNTFYSSAQTHCGSVELFLEEQGGTEFVFNNFSSYEGGFPRKTIARIKIRVKDKTTPDILCSWNLKIKLDNDGAPTDELEEFNLYGDGLGQNPLLSILEIRAINDCMTSEDFSNFVPLSDVNNVLELIKPQIGALEASDVISAGSCAQNVNSAGDYISNYSEFTFKIELRIKPGMSFNPGTYGLTFNFRLEENI